MSSPAFRPLAKVGLLAALSTCLFISGCQSFLNSRYSDSLPPEQGIVAIKGLASSVSVRRNSLGMPLIETNSFHDALFTLGYVHAGDRLSQMVSLRLMAEGRLAEMAGPGVLEMDRFMRAVNLRQSAEVLYKAASPRMKTFFEVYARGVNAYLFRYRDKLPMDLAQAGYRPAYWKPEDSVLVFCLLNFGLSVNLQEEIAALVMAQKVGSDNLAWLLPTYPDEPLPFEESDKLKGLKLDGQIAGLQAVAGASAQFAEAHMLGVAASNNWAIAPQNSRSGKSLLANDTHLPLSMPSAWNFVQIRAPKFQAAGVSIAGVPAIVAGFNGKLGWGMTMVMGDNQDLFLERVKREGNRLLYQADGKWVAARERQETFFIKGERPIRETLYETRNGPLLNSVLGARKHPLQPLQMQSGYGLALKTTQFEADSSLDAFFDLSRAQSVDEAFEATREVRAMPLNIVFADAQHIGWQVTGRFPNRKAGLGLVPSPGWDGQYGWDGFADPMLHPYDQDPQQGWLGTANHRTAPRGYGMQLSNSWFYPDRYERLAELAGSGKHDTRSMIAMQYDQTSPFVAKLQAMLNAPGMAEPLRAAIDALPAAERSKAREALDRLLAFDGKLAATSADAALYGAFLHESARQIFLDELGPDSSPAWQALVATANSSYSAQADHLLGREDSPFWNDTRTAMKEDKPAILARSLAGAVTYAEQRLGSERSAWQWGKLHTYSWTTETSKLAPYLSSSQRAGIQSLKGYLDRGPYPAGGDHSTLNVSAYNWGQDFDTWLIPAMRLVIDFGREEPMIGLNSSGQSGNPASRHYADGIEAWRQGQYMSFPFQSQNLDKVYGTRRLLLTPTK
ncbi:acyl-homoserine-lactone acylase [Pseudomonas cuatrocienegasensis]|uniref:Acyl-homoserine lactone acylase QuiP n=1 Tax=Pseudomonas cuatrocienegasensis TaxID=543360 RepID=A0ABY1B4G3_9PSED|nr:MULTISPECIES: penicillin acylase family protein [Pseudomonas]OEC37229.1 acyl-homoserine lactone acylase subunit beta [Pseudomonas sp. 21C1]SEP89829.1 acyl-homoserine-lactone acylase [Pseudomonas cuatrocienegasensis]